MSRLKWHNASLGIESAWATTDGHYTDHEFRIFRTHEGVRLEVWRNTAQRPLALGLLLAAPSDPTSDPVDDRAEAVARLKAEADRWLPYFCPQLRRSA